MNYTTTLPGVSESTMVNTVAPFIIDVFNMTATPSTLTQPFCQYILLEDVGETRVRLWDCILLGPNVLFLLYLLYKLPISITKLRNTNSPIFLAFHVLVCLVAGTSVLRCIVSMTVNAALPIGDYTDRVLWLILRFLLLATEMSVVIFGLAFGHLDSRTSIRRVLLVTTTLALAYSLTQGTLEFVHHEKNNIAVINRSYSLFGHGGMLFWFATSVLFFFTYILIASLPLTSLRQRLALPTKRSFYVYCALLSVLNLGQAVGSMLLYNDAMAGMCVVDVTTYLYFTLFAPLVYLTFLRDFFRPLSESNISYTYRPQVDEGADDDVLTLPHQSSGSVKSNSTALPSAATMNYDNTQFASPNPLYITNSSASSINGDFSISQSYFADEST